MLERIFRSRGDAVNSSLRKCYLTTVLQMQHWADIANVKAVPTAMQKLRTDTMTTLVEIYFTFFATFLFTQI